MRSSTQWTRSAKMGICSYASGAMEYDAYICMVLLSVTCFLRGPVVHMVSGNACESSPGDRNSRCLSKFIYCRDVITPCMQVARPAVSGLQYISSPAGFVRHESYSRLRRQEPSRRLPGSHLHVAILSYMRKWCSCLLLGWA